MRRPHRRAVATECGPGLGRLARRGGDAADLRDAGGHDFERGTIPVAGGAVAAGVGRICQIRVCPYSAFQTRAVMRKRLRAVYANGVLRPLEPLELGEQQVVTLTLADGADQEDALDTKYEAWC